MIYCYAPNNCNYHTRHVWAPVLLCLFPTKPKASSNWSSVITISSIRYMQFLLGMIPVEIKIHTNLCSYSN